MKNYNFPVLKTTINEFPNTIDKNTYDSVIKEFFKDNIQNSNVIEPKSLWEFQYNEITCYRTWHPSTIKYNAKKNKLEYYKDIISRIKAKQT